MPVWPQHPTQHSTAPCSVGREKGGHGAAKWAKEAKVLINARGEPGHLFPMYFSQLLSAPVFLPEALWILKPSLLPCQVFMSQRPWVEDQMLFHQGLFPLKGSSEGRQHGGRGECSLSWVEEGELILNRQLLEGNSWITEHQLQKLYYPPKHQGTIKTDRILGFVSAFPSKGWNEWRYPVVPRESGEWIKQNKCRGKDRKAYASVPECLKQWRWEK